MIIYCITNRINGMQYVGQTKQTLEERVKQHKYSYRSNVGKAIRTFGMDSFDYEIIEECNTAEDLDERERYWIRELNTIHPNSYNLIEGGRGNFDPQKSNKCHSSKRLKFNNVKFDVLYNELKQKIERSEYPFHSIFPSEKILTDQYNCSRGTVRRALAGLIERGYIQTQQGKRIRVIYKPVTKNEFKMGGIESFKEAAARNHFVGTTKVVKLESIVADEKIAELTEFEIGDELYEVYRVRYIDGKPLIFDINYFLKTVVHDLTEEIAINSIYEYLENTLGIVIVTSKRKLTTELATELDYQYLELSDFNCLAVISGHTFNSDGIQFEFTQSRHRPDFFSFQDTATRTKYNII